MSKNKMMIKESPNIKGPVENPKTLYIISPCVSLSLSSGRTLNFFSKGACCSLCFLHSYSKIIRLIASFPIVSSIVLTLFTQLNSDSHPAVVFICACNIYYFDPTFVLPQNHYRCGGGIMAC